MELPASSHPLSVTADHSGAYSLSSRFSQGSEHPHKGSPSLCHEVQERKEDLTSVVKEVLSVQGDRKGKKLWVIEAHYKKYRGLYHIHINRCIYLFIHYVY